MSYNDNLVYSIHLTFLSGNQFHNISIVYWCISNNSTTVSHRPVGVASVTGWDIAASVHAMQARRANPAAFQSGNWQSLLRQDYVLATCHLPYTCSLHHILTTPASHVYHIIATPGGTHLAPRREPDERGHRLSGGRPPRGCSPSSPVAPRHLWRDTPVRYKQGHIGK